MIPLLCLRMWGMEAYSFPQGQEPVSDGTRIWAQSDSRAHTCNQCVVMVKGDFQEGNTHSQLEMQWKVWGAAFHYLDSSVTLVRILHSRCVHWNPSLPPLHSLTEASVLLVGRYSVPGLLSDPCSCAPDYRCRCKALSLCNRLCSNSKLIQTFEGFSLLKRISPFLSTLWIPTHFIYLFFKQSSETFPLIILRFSNI